jgi:hypothetical protein
MSADGHLAINACFAKGQISKLSVTLDRPAVARLFIGKTAAAVIATVPVLYSLCSRAQGLAARAAFAAATGEPVPEPDNRALWLEFLHENLWRLLLDWPLALGLPSAKDEFVAWRAQRGGEQCIPLTRTLVHGQLHSLVEKCLDQLLEYHQPQALRQAAQGGAEESQAAAILSIPAPDDWLAHWRGELTTSPALRRPTSPAAALRQRLAEVTTATTALAAGAPYPLAAAGGSGWGVGQALTARGVLTHAVQLAGGRVSNYQVWAPTDFHFSDAGGLQALTDGVTFATPAAARAALHLAVLALDPCLPYEVELRDA